MPTTTSSAITTGGEKMSADLKKTCVAHDVHGGVSKVKGANSEQVITQHVTTHYAGPHGSHVDSAPSLKSVSLSRATQYYLSPLAHELVQVVSVVRKLASCICTSQPQDILSLMMRCVSLTSRLHFAVGKNL